MQPAPTEASQTATSVHQFSHTTSLHHGLSDSPEPAPGSLLPEDAGLPSHQRDDPDTASVSSRATSRGRQLNAGRVSSRHGSSQDSSPGSRIDEYEKAHAIIRKPSDGMIFQVVPTSQISNVSIQEFPNGKPPSIHLHSLLTYSQRC